MENTSTDQYSASDVEQSIRRNNYKLTADKIFQILDELSRDPSVSNRRWIWELMQNAKDVPNRFGRVSVEIRLTEDSLSFAHNGDAFHVENITGLIQQVSSKPSNSSSEETTGKFGTGFISTHLLADVIELEGVVKRPEDARRKFTLTLDRSGSSSEELLESISESLERIRRLDDDSEFELLEGYEQKRTEDGLHTIFCYNLEREENQEAAQTGVADLVNTLPGTMVNLPKLKQVRVFQVDGSEQYYRSEKIREEGPIQWYTVTIEDSKQNTLTTRYFLAYANEKLRLFTEVESFDNLTLIIPAAKQPMLYRDFPLIGSEKFHYPFALNGFSFYPTEQRDSILLSGSKDKPVHNRELLAVAQEAALEFTDWLLLHNVQNRYILANTRIPETKMDDKAAAWFKEQQQAWRTELLDKPLVETDSDAGAVPLRKVRIPRFCAGASMDENDPLWDLAAEYCGLDAVPKKDHLEAWIKALGVVNEMSTWDAELFIDEEDLLNMVAEAGELSALPFENDEVAIAWLNRLYAFLSTHQQLELLNKKAGIPNHRGQFQKLDDLYVENTEEQIAEPILDVLEKLGEPWRDELMHRDIELSELKHKQRGLAEASATINGILSKEERTGNIIKSDFLHQEDAEGILVAILRLTTEDAKTDSYRRRVFFFAKDLLHFDEGLLQVEKLGPFSFDTAARLMTRWINQQISATKTVVVLAAKLHQSEGETVRWLGNYLRFLESSSENKYLLEEGNIVPNRLHQLCAYEDLFNYGTQDQELDDELLAILKEFDPKQDWMPELLADTVGLKLTPRTFTELGEELTALVNDVTNPAHEQYEEYRGQLLRVIGWCREHPTLAGRYLESIVKQSGRIFFTLTVERSGKSAEIMQIMSNPEALSDLAAISDSGVDTKKLRTLAGLTAREGMMDKLLDYANGLEQKAQDFESNFAIGREMEELFYVALKAEGIDAEIKYQGIGDCDFVVTNPANQKRFYIEIKSYAAGWKGTALNVAISQAERAVLSPNEFALCVIPRPANLVDIDADYVQKSLTYVPGSSGGFNQVMIDWATLQNLTKRSNREVELDVEFAAAKVRVTHGFIDSKYNNFDQLVSDITTAIQ